ncbi:MAG TPA: sulfotransferase [Gaiellaceae bacterium]
MNPWVFVVGCPRSGTTLLQRMLDHHPQLAVANDTHFIPHGVIDPTDQAEPPLTAEIVERVRSYRRFHRLGLPDEAVTSAADRARTYPEFVQMLYDELARIRGKPLAGEKTPSYVRRLPLLHRLFPSARVIHVIRDGRDVALSALEWATETKGPGKRPLWRDEPVGVCALWWRRHVLAGRKDGQWIGRDGYAETRYEQLVADAESELRRITTFLHLPYASEMAEFHVGKTRSDPGLSAKSAWLPPTPGLRDWRSGMAERDLALFEELAGDLLDELGYARAVPSTPATERKRAARIRERFAEQFGAVGATANGGGG